MENKEEIIINENVKTVKVKKQKPLSEEQREKHYKHRQEVLERMKRYQLNKLELAQIEMLHEIQQERSIDLMTGDISQEDYDKLQQKINDKLAHFHLSS